MGRSRSQECIHSFFGWLPSPGDLKSVGGYHTCPVTACRTMNCSFGSQCRGKVLNIPDRLICYRVHAGSSQQKHLSVCTNYTQLVLRAKWRYMRSIGTGVGWSVALILQNGTQPRS